MTNLLLKEIKDNFDSTAIELSRLNLDIVQAELTVKRCEKYSFGWWQQAELVKALKERQTLTRKRLAGYAIDLYNEKTRLGL